MVRKTVDPLYGSSVDRCIDAREGGGVGVQTTCLYHLLVPSGFGQPHPESIAFIIQWAIL